MRAILTALTVTCAPELSHLCTKGFSHATKNKQVNCPSSTDAPLGVSQDTLHVQELRFGDNDTLSAQIAVLVAADWLVLLTDVDYLYTANPRNDPTATPIEVRLVLARLSSRLAQHADVIC